MTYKQIVTNIIEREAERYARVLFETAGVESPLLFTELDELGSPPRCDYIDFIVMVEAPVKHYKFYITGNMDSLGYITCELVRNNTKFGTIIWAENLFIRETLGISYFKLP